MHQTTGERNYHIFYQLLKGAHLHLPAALCEELLGLHGASIPSYSYLASSVSAADIPNVSDAGEFAEMISCMNSIGIEEVMQHDIFRLIAGILHLGNVDFQQDELEEGLVSAGSSDNSSDDLRRAAQLLGFNTDELITSMTRQNMYVSGATIVKVQSYTQV